MKQLLSSMFLLLLGYTLIACNYDNTTTPVHLSLLTTSEADATSVQAIALGQLKVTNSLQSSILLLKPLAVCTLNSPDPTQDCAKLGHQIIQPTSNLTHAVIFNFEDDMTINGKSLCDMPLSLLLQKDILNPSKVLKLSKDANGTPMFQDGFQCGANQVGLVGAKACLNDGKEACKNPEGKTEEIDTTLTENMFKDSLILDHFSSSNQETFGYFKNNIYFVKDYAQFSSLSAQEPFTLSSNQIDVFNETYLNRKNDLEALSARYAIGDKLTSEILAAKGARSLFHMAPTAVESGVDLAQTSLYPSFLTNIDNIRFIVRPQDAMDIHWATLIDDKPLVYRVTTTATNDYSLITNPDNNSLDFSLCQVDSKTNTCMTEYPLIGSLIIAQTAIRNVHLSKFEIETTGTDNTSSLLETSQSKPYGRAAIVLDSTEEYIQYLRKYQYANDAIPKDLFLKGENGAPIINTVVNLLSAHGLCQEAGVQSMQLQSFMLMTFKSMTPSYYTLTPKTEADGILDVSSCKTGNFIYIDQIDLVIGEEVTVEIDNTDRAFIVSDSVPWN